MARGQTNQAIADALVAPLPGAAGRYVVVTREQMPAANTTAYEGLRPS